MTLTLIIENFQTGFHITTSFTNDDFKTLDKHWHRSDSLLKEMNELGHFDNRNTWSQLLPNHWFILVSKNLEKFLQLEPRKQIDPKHRTVESFHFLLLGLIRCLEAATDQSIDLLRIQVFKDGTYNYQTHSSFLMSYKGKANSYGPTLSVVVDNTDKK